MCIHVDPAMYTQIYIYMYMYLIYTHIYLYRIYTYTIYYTYTGAYVCIYIYTCTCSCMFEWAYIHPWKPKSHVDTVSYICMCIRIYIYIYCMHECIYIHIYPYMSTHACLHICWCRYVAMQDSSCRLWYTCSYRCGKFDILYISCDAQFVQILSWDSYRFVFQDITVYSLLSMVFFLLARTIYCSWVSSSPSSSPWPWDVLQPFRWF